MKIPVFLVHQIVYFKSSAFATSDGDIAMNPLIEPSNRLFYQGYQLQIAMLSYKVQVQSSEFTMTI